MSHVLLRYISGGDLFPLCQGYMLHLDSRIGGVGCVCACVFLRKLLLIFLSYIHIHVHTEFCHPFIGKYCFIFFCCWFSTLCPSISIARKGSSEKEGYMLLFWSRPQKSMEMPLLAGTSAPPPKSGGIVLVLLLATRL